LSILNAIYFLVNYFFLTVGGSKRGIQALDALLAHFFLEVAVFGHS